MESESSTRKQRIDPRLKMAGWSIRPFDPTYPASPPRNMAVEEWPTTVGPADYALCDDARFGARRRRGQEADGRCRRACLPQAERYSRAISRAGMAGRVRRARSCTRPTARRSGSTTSVTR